MKLTEQQFIESLTADQSSFFNARLIEIRDKFQASYAASIAEVAAAKDQLLIDEKAEHAATKVLLEESEAQLPELKSEIDRLTALIPPPLPARSIYPRELLARFTFAEVVAAIRTDNDAAIYAVANLQTTVSPVSLDSEETRTLIGALVVAKIITPERLAEILA